MRRKDLAGKVTSRIMHFLFRLIAPRPSFAQDMSEEERKVMQAHVAYWKDLMDKGLVVVFGPVLDPKGVWGVGIVEVADEVEARALAAKDPAVGLNRVEIFPMSRAIVRG